MLADTKLILPSKPANPLPDWKSLVHAGYDAERALRAVATARADSIGLPNALRIKLAIGARLRGEQDRGYAASVYRSRFTENPIREGIVKDCLLYELEHRDELKNVRGNNFRDRMSKAILEAGRIDTYERTGRKSEESSLVRNTLPKIIRARIGALSLPEIQHWLMEGRQESVTNYFYRILLHVAQERSASESSASLKITCAGARPIFYPAGAESKSDRLHGLMRLTPMFLNATVDIIALRDETNNSQLGSDAAFIREKLAHKTAGSASIAAWLRSVPVLEKIVEEP